MIEINREVRDVTINARRTAEMRRASPAQTVDRDDHVETLEIWPGGTHGPKGAGHNLDVNPAGQ